MSTDIALQTTAYQVGNLSWKLSRVGDSYHPNVTLDISKFSSGAGTNEVQTLTAGGTVSGGTFTLSYEGATTAAIVYNATAAQVQAALEGISPIGPGNVLGGGGPLPTTPVTVTFQGALAGRNVDQMTVTSSLTGSSPTLTPTTTTAGVNGHFLNGYIPSGTALGKVTASGLYGPYDDTQSDGRQVFAGFLIADVRVIRQNGTTAAKVGSGMLVRGDVREVKLPFQNGPGAIDAAGKADNVLIRYE